MALVIWPSTSIDVAIFKCHINLVAIIFLHIALSFLANLFSSVGVKLFTYNYIVGFEVDNPVSLTAECDIVL